MLSITGLSQDLESLIKKYPDKDACNLEISRHIDIQLNNGELEITQVETHTTMYLSEKVPSAMKESVHFSSFYQLTDLKAQSYIPKSNGKYKKEVVKEFMLNTNTSSYAFYDDSKEKVFYFTGLKKGAKTSYTSTFNLTQPNLMSGFFFQSYYPTEHSEFTISVPEGVEIDFKSFHTDTAGLTFTKTPKGSATIYSWIGTSIPGFDYEPNAPNPRFYIPQIHPYLVTSQGKDGATNHLGSVDNLHGWYRSLIDGYDKEEESNDQLKEIVDSIVADIPTELEKVKAIYMWVQSNIQYIAFEYELAGFVPRPAGLVCTRRFGDCKDMSSIMKEMMDIAGIKSYLTWIGTRTIPYQYTELATPSVDNHMITTYIDENGRAYFLDGTDKYLTFGDASSHIQGKEALISLSPEEYKIETVPESPADYSQMIDSVWIHVDGESIKGKGKFIETGHFKNFSTYRLVGKNDKEKQTYFKSVLEKGSNKFRLNSYDVTNLNDNYKPLTVTYDFQVDNFIQSYEDELYIDMNLYEESGTIIEDDRELPFEYRFKKKHEETYILDIPEGYEVSYLPEGFDKTIDGFRYSISYTLVDNKVIYNLKLYREIMIMDKSYFEPWNDLFNQLLKSRSETVVLKKKN